MSKNKNKKEMGMNFFFLLIAFIFGLIGNLLSSELQNLLYRKPINFGVVIFSIIVIIWLCWDFSKRYLK